MPDRSASSSADIAEFSGLCQRVEFGIITYIKSANERWPEMDFRETIDAFASGMGLAAASVGVILGRGAGGKPAFRSLAEVPA